MFKPTQDPQRCAQDSGIARTIRRLSPEAAQFYADVYVAARASCCRELRRCGCSGEEAEEFFMATCEKVMRLIDPIARAFEPPQMVALLRIASRRVLIDDRRHGTVLRQVDFERAGPLTDDSAATPDEIVLDREIVAIAREAISALPSRDQRIFRLRHQFDLAPQEVREQLPGLSHRAYRRRIEKGNTKVLQAFDEISSGRRCREMELVYLPAHARGTASRQQAEAVDLHLAHCSPCKQTYARLLRARCNASRPDKPTRPRYRDATVA
jgi:RNA polymerase sigma factor (sigma-70 family)